MKRRLEDASLPDLFSPHRIRVTVVTDLLNRNVPLEDLQYLAGHSSPTTIARFMTGCRRESPAISSNGFLFIIDGSFGHVRSPFQDYCCENTSAL